MNEYRGQGKYLPANAHPQWVKLTDRLCGIARIGALALVRQFSSGRPAKGPYRGGCSQ